MSQIKLIALDMDGTLLNSEDKVSDYTKDVIEKALAKGVHVVLSTGRWLKSCYPYAEELNLSNYLVTCNGGQIWTFEKELVEEHLLPQEQIEKMWHIAEKQDVYTWLVSTEQVYYNDRPQDFYGHDWLKFGCETKDEEKLEAIIKDLSYLEGLELTNSLPTNIEVNPEGVNKASALEKVCENLGITMDNVLACGDSLNDIKMIQAAGVGVAVGNAQEAIKKAADFTAETNDEDGVAKAIEKFVLNID